MLGFYYIKIIRCVKSATIVSLRKQSVFELHKHASMLDNQLLLIIRWNGFEPPHCAEIQREISRVLFRVGVVTLRVVASRSLSGDFLHLN